jgi:hypothetical protein
MHIHAKMVTEPCCICEVSYVTYVMCSILVQAWVHVKFQESSWKREKSMYIIMHFHSLV